MLKYLWACALAMTATLSAEPLGDIDFSFPPSQYEWKLLTDGTLLQNVISPSIFDEVLENVSIKVLTHREGDALEILWVLQAEADDDSEEFEDDEEASAEQRELVLSLFPNHQWIHQEIHEDLMLYGLRDGTTDLFHGYVRGFENNHRYTTLIYLSTALETEQNRALWLHALESASYLP